MVVGGRGRNGELSMFLARVLSRDEDFVLGGVGTDGVLMGSGSIGNKCLLGAGSEVLVGSLAVSASVGGRSVPLSVLCRSSSVVIMGGGDNVMIRPNGKGCSRALIGTLVTRASSLSSRNKDREYNVIREVSGSASNVLLITGDGGTREVLDRNFGGGAVGEGCVTLICNIVSGGFNGVITPVNEDGASEGGVTMASRGDGRTMAGFGILRECGGSALIRLVLRAKEARRVEMRVSCVKRPIIGSPVCNEEGMVGSCNRVLRTRCLKFGRPVAKGFVRFDIPPRGRFVRVLRRFGGLWGV